MISGLTDDVIHRNASAESIRRGSAYRARGAVVSIAVRGREVEARVEGSTYEAYRVRIAFDAAGVTEAACSCPYAYGGWCKHVVAVLLTCLHEPDAVASRPSLDELLDAMDRPRLVALLRELAARDPSIAAHIERHAIHPDAPRPGTRRTEIDGKAVRRRVRDALRSLGGMRPSEAYWHVGGVVEAIRDELAQVRPFIEAGDGENALAYLDALTDAYVDGWTALDDSNGEAGDFFTELGRAWTEAVLVADLPRSERSRWAAKLDAWDRETEDYGIDGAFAPAAAAAEQGWDDPALRRRLADDAEEPPPPAADEDPGDERPWYADEIAEARLAILERQGRTEAYLRLAAAEGRVDRYVLMLVRLGRIDDAERHALRAVHRSATALDVAQALREHGALDAALRVGEHGLTMNDYDRGALAVWVCELALGMGRPERALEAAVVAFHSLADLDAYRRVEALAGPDWPRRREALLARTRAARTTSRAKVDIFLHEGLHADAMAAADEAAPYDADLVRRIVPAVFDEHPAWVLRAARRHAEPIIAEGRSGAYGEAVDWLGHVRTAYHTLDDDDAWQEYLAALRAEHGRKYKLMGLLKARF